MIRVVLPFHLRKLANVGQELELEVRPPVTLASILDALEERYPVLRGTIRDHDTRVRRPFLRFFAGVQEALVYGIDVALEAVAAGTAPFLIVGAMAGG